MNQVDNFLRNMESRYPSVYQMLGGERARSELMDMQAEIERARNRLRNQPNIVLSVRERHVVRKAKIGGCACSAGWMEEVPVIVLEKK